MRQATQGSSFLATLGWLTQSRWDCKSAGFPAFAWPLHDELVLSINSQTTRLQLEVGLRRILEFIKQNESAHSELSESLVKIIKNTGCEEIGWTTWKVVPLHARTSVAGD